VAGVCFIAPAFFIVLGVAWLYQRAGALPQAAGLLRGVKPVVVAIVIQALIGLGLTAIKNVPLALAAVAVFVASLFRWLDEVALLLIVGTGAGLIAWVRVRTRGDGAAGGEQVGWRTTFKEVQRGDAAYQAPTHPSSGHVLQGLRKPLPTQHHVGLPVSMSSTKSAMASTFPSRINSRGVRSFSWSFPR
jgi:chromate transport protein ChrA